MQSGWRLYAVMIGLAALTGTIVALALSGGPRLPSESPRRETPAASTFAAATATASPTRSPSTQPSATPTASATATPLAIPSGADPLTRIRPLVFAWRPKDTTAIAAKQTATGTRIVAVALDGSTITPLVDLPTGTQWHMRLDGSAIAMTVEIQIGPLSRTRIAALNFQTGALSWVTPDEQFASQRSPRWSNDGTVVYYTRTSYDQTIDLGVYRIRVDGSNLTQLRPASNDGAIQITGLTPDGLGLVLSRSQLSGLVDVLDLNTRVIRSFATPSVLAGERPSATVTSWRPQRPRALVIITQPAGGPRLYVWDDVAPPASPNPAVNDAVFGADWDPTASRIVASLSPTGARSERPQLVTMDPGGQNRATLAGTEGGSNPYWLRAGIIYLWTAGASLPTEVRLAQPGGVSSKLLYSDTDIIALTYVSP